MSKYTQSSELQKFINWDVLMDLPRYAGGHDAQMQSLFRDAEVIGHWNEGDYQGMVATAVKLPDGRYVAYNDYYGSCSGCDSWSDANNEAVTNMCINLANGAYIFNSKEDLIEFLSLEEEGDSWSSWSAPKSNLLNEINKSQV